MKRAMSFDRLAPFYRSMEFLAAGNKLQRCRLMFLDKISSPSRVLLVGEGHGRFLPVITRRFPEATVVVVDSSLKMLDISRSKIRSNYVEFVHADLLQWTPTHGEFDLIVTHFFLDCFPADELAMVVNRLAEMAAPSATWLIADFEIAPSRIAGMRCRIILALLYAFFQKLVDLRASSLVSPDPMLKRAGFTLVQRSLNDWGMLKSDWWQRNRR